MIERAKMVYSDKILDAIALCVRPDVRQMTFEGSIRSTKTVDAIEGFFRRCYYSDGTMHLVGSYDTDTLNNNILQANGFGLLSRFRDRCRYRKDKIGGNYIEMDGKKGRKKILLATYSNRAKWKKVLGGSIENIFVDEANVADPQFIDECYSRQVSFDHPFTLYTLNGDVPTASIYNYINPSKIIGSAPASIRADMDTVEKKPGYFYMHWTMRDNPIMTEDKIAAAESTYPVDSYYYKIKILGERGAPGKLIYIDYIREDQTLVPLDAADYHSFTVSMDVGATRATNSISLVGFKHDLSEAGVLHKDTFRECGYVEKTEKLKAFVQKSRALGAYNIECIIVDSAEQNYIRDLQTEFSRLGLPPVIGSYKATIKERIDLGIILLARGRLKFNRTDAGKAALAAFKQASWQDGKEGEVRKDDNEEWNDILDSIEYSLTRHMRGLLRSAGA